MTFPYGFHDVKYTFSIFLTCVLAVQSIPLVNAALHISKDGLFVQTHLKRKTKKKYGIHWLSAGTEYFCNNETKSCKKS